MAGYPISVFRPIGDTASLAAATTSARVARVIGGFANDPGNIRIANTGSVVAFVEFGDSTITSTATAGMPILPNTVEVFEIRQNETHVAAITASGSTTLYLTTGEGS